MSRRSLGIGLIAIGLSLVLGGVVVAMSGSTEDIEAAPSTVATPTTSGTTSAVDASETENSVPVAPTTTTSPSTTTTAVSETVAEFIDLFSAALTNGDREFVLGRLHPAVVDGFPPEVCLAWVEGEIMALTDYRMTGEPEGPVDKNVSIAGQPVTITAVVSVPVSFSFRGQSFDSTADFALVDGVIYWLGSCA